VADRRRRRAGRGGAADLKARALAHGVCVLKPPLSSSGTAAGTAGDYKNAKAKKWPRHEEGAVANRFYAGKAACSGQTELGVLAAVALGLLGFVAVRLKSITSLLPRAASEVNVWLGMQTTDALLPQRHPIEEARIPGPKCKPAFHLRPLGPPKRASDAPL
jgi:hypothetical protein